MYNDNIPEVTSSCNNGEKGFTKFFSKNRNARFMNVLALILLVYAMWYFGVLLFITVPPDNVRFVDTVIGFLLGSVVGVVINYYFGSAATTKEWDGSERRLDEIQSQSNPPTPPRLTHDYPEDTL